MTPFEIGTAIGVAGVYIIILLEKRRERRASKRGLLPNPARCEKMADRMTRVEKDIEYIREDIGEIKEHIG